MKTKEEVLALFRGKYDHLKSVYPEVGSFDEAASTNFYQNPDGGWQLNLSPCAAITLRPGDKEAHETHGAICERWYSEGGAFNETGIPGWLGYPISDEERKVFRVCPPCPMYMRFWNPPLSSVSGASGRFEFGTIEWHEELTWERANEHHAYDNAELILLDQGFEDACDFGESEEWFASQNERYDAAKQRLQKGIKPDPRQLCMSAAEFALPSTITMELNESGKQYVPPDIDAAVRTLLSIRNLHEAGNMTHVCEFQGGRAYWIFNMASEDFSRMIIKMSREGSNLRVTIDATPRSMVRRKLNTFLQGVESKHEEFTMPNNFKVMRRK